MPAGAIRGAADTNWIVKKAGDFTNPVSRRDGKLLQG
jgi:hypothetical protein